MAKTLEDLREELGEDLPIIVSDHVTKIANILSIYPEHARRMLTASAIAITKYQDIQETDTQGMIDYTVDVLSGKEKT